MLVLDISSRSRLLRAILPVLETIRDLNIPMGLLSNTNKAHWEWIYRQQYSIVHGWFDPIILSYEVQAMKPGKTIYEVAAKQAGFPAEQIFFTDDRLDNIEGAKAMSWQVSQFIDADSLMTIVKTWG